MIRRIDFDQILPIWSEKLWPGRASVIEQVSWLRLGGGYLEKSQLGDASFLGAFLPGDNCLLVGVSSGFMTEQENFRIRGTWVNEGYREHGIGAALLRGLFEQAQRERAHLIWTLPRKSSWRFYLRMGFVAVTPWTEEFEFGPNRFAVRPVSF